MSKNTSKNTSKKKINRKSAGPKQNQPAADAGRRKFVLLGAGALAAAGVGLVGAYNAGWLGSESTESSSSDARSKTNDLGSLALTASVENALRAASEMLEHYARELNNASVLIHAVRGFGKTFKLAGGANAVDHLCSRYALGKELNGKRYVYFKREAEVHENSFLKTFLEAGVSLDQPVMAGGNRYALRDLAESGKSLFRCEPKNIYQFDDDRFRYDTSYLPPRAPGSDLRGELMREHLPWGLIAFSTLTPPEKASWVNAYGETIDLAAAIDRSLAEYESVCALGREELERGDPAPKNFRDSIKKYSCFGLHSVYGFLVCVKNGYRNDGVPDRVRQTFDFVTHRLKGDAEAIDREYAEEGNGAPPQLVEAFRQRALVKFYGHAFESINYVKLHKLWALTESQERRIQAGEKAFYESVVKLRAMDWGMIRKSLGDKFISDAAIALGHAARAMKLLTPQNPDTAA